MKIKNFVDKTTNFLFRRLSELSGGVLLILSIITDNDIKKNEIGINNEISQID